jgi:hypothetical protein
MIRPRKLPADTNQRAQQVAKLLIGEAEIPAEPAQSQVSAYLSQIGHRGGLKGGVARAKALSARKRSSIAAKAANARWKK